jgi:replicative DNA helicase
MHNYTEHLERILQHYTINMDRVELSRALQRLQSDLGAGFMNEAATQPIGSVVTRRLKDLAEGHDKLRITSGFSDLDKLAGLHAGELLVIGGRPGMGKTSLMVNLAVNLAQKKVAVLYMSLDLADWQIADRFMSNISKLSVDHFNQVPPPYTENAARLAVSELEVLPVHIASEGLFHIEVLTACIHKAVKERSVKVIFIDYLQLTGTIHRRYNRESELAGITRALKNLAKELKVCIVAASQLSRAVENRPGGSKRPQLSDLRESGTIEQDADKVLFLYRAEYYGLEVDENNEPTTNTMEVIVAKNKSGALGTFKLHIEPRFTGFTDDVEPRLIIPDHWMNEPDDS